MANLSSVRTRLRRLEKRGSTHTWLEHFRTDVGARWVRWNYRNPNGHVSCADFPEELSMAD